MWASQVALVVKRLPAEEGDVDSIPGSGRSPGGGHGNSLQHSCLENPMDRGAWWATIHRVTKSQTQLKWLRTHGRNENLLYSTRNATEHSDDLTGKEIQKKEGIYVYVQLIALLYSRS